MESVSTPRISADMLDSYVGQNVIVVGKVMQLRGESALLDANGQVNAILNHESHLMAGNAAQIIGKVNPDLSVRVYNALDLGNNVDFQVAQSVVEVTHQYKDFSTVVLLRLFSLIIAIIILPRLRLGRQHLRVIGSPSSRLDYQTTSPNRSTRAENRYSASSDVFSSTSSLDYELSQLVIKHNDPSNNEPSSPQFTRPASYHSSSSENFSSTSSLDRGLSQLVIDHDQPSFSQLTTSEAHHSWRSNQPRTPPRPATAASYCSSSSQVLSSVPDSLDDVFSQLANEEESPFPSQSTNQRTQSSELSPQKAKFIESPESSFPTTPVREREAPSPVFGSPSSTGKLSTGCPSPVQSPTRSTPSSSTRSPRLYRTRSGNLATLAELRQRREREEEFLDIILRGIMIPEDGRVTSRPSVAMRLNESGRWRIDSIQEPWGA
ncbi:replication factor A protein 3-domain-containing protein [Nemania abortiva]|nr:replication factor A protein 3-domain-containing protein [Nemania abortiva]